MVMRFFHLNMSCKIQPLSGGVRRYQIALATVFTLVAAWLGAWAWERARPERHLAEAARHLREGRPEEALYWLGLPEAASATRDRALLLRARIALARGRPAEAVGPLERIDPAGPCAADAAFWKGRTLYEAHQTLRAFAWFQRAVEVRPDDIEGHRWLAVAAYEQGDSPSAIAALQAVTRLRPEDAPAWRTMGLLFKEANEDELARAAYETSLRLDPRQSRVRLELAEVLVKTGLFAEAERHLEGCREKPLQVERCYLLAQCRLALGDEEGYRQRIRSGLAADPGHAGLLSLGATVDLVDGRPAEALERLDRALAADPLNARWLYQRGMTLRRLGRSHEAERELAKAGDLKKSFQEVSDLEGRAARYPGDPDVRCRLGQLCTKLGNPTMAATWFRAALACDPGHAGARSGLDALGRP